jgi:hypothetical protein
MSEIEINESIKNQKPEEIWVVDTSKITDEQKEKFIEFIGSFLYGKQFWLFSDKNFPAND